MKKILGHNYLSDKECENRYGYSKHWFIKRRYTKKPPTFIKIGGRIFYDMDETDNWFKKFMFNT